MAEEKLIVHHGSALSNCVKIKNDRKFIPSENRITLMKNILEKNGNYHLAALTTNLEINQYPIEENKHIQKYYQALETKQASYATA